MKKEASQMYEGKATTGPTWVVCLCAEWCGLCRDYRAVMQSMAARYPAWRFAWMDIEDQADVLSEVLGDMEIETFPTLLIADADGLRFLGPLQPQPEHLARLLGTVEQGKLPVQIKHSAQSAQVQWHHLLPLLQTHPAWLITG